MITPGDIVPRRDTANELYVVVVSNSIHLAANTGRVITCPFIPGPLPDTAMAMVVSVFDPQGAVLPELVQWLPVAGLDEPISNIGTGALRETAAIIAALMS